MRLSERDFYMIMKLNGAVLSSAVLILDMYLNFSSLGQGVRLHGPIFGIAYDPLSSVWNDPESDRYGSATPFHFLFISSSSWFPVI